MSAFQGAPLGASQAFYNPAVSSSPVGYSYATTTTTPRVFNQSMNGGGSCAAPMKRSPQMVGPEYAAAASPMMMPHKSHNKGGHGHHVCSHNHAHHAHKSSKRSNAVVKSRSVQPNYWESALCNSEAAGGGFSLCAAKRRRRREPKPKMFDDEMGRISVDSASDWDEFEANERVWGQRRGPAKERTSDDLLITFRDLLPCCGPIFDKCGCCGDSRPKKRALIRPRGPPSEAGPRIETVCLECGNVLGEHNLPGSVAVDMFDRGTPERALAMEQIGASKASKPAFEGYQEWEVLARGNERVMTAGNVPLPNFGQAPARMFKNSPVPGKQPAPRGDRFDIDETGHISLPQFQEPTATTTGA